MARSNILLMITARGIKLLNLPLWLTVKAHAMASDGSITNGQNVVRVAGVGLKPGRQCASIPMEKNSQKTCASPSTQKHPKIAALNLVQDGKLEIGHQYEKAPIASNRGHTITFSNFFSAMLRVVLVSCSGLIGVKSKRRKLMPDIVHSSLSLPTFRTVIKVHVRHGKWVTGQR